LLIQQTIALKGFGSTLSFRRLENIDFKSERDAVDVSKINYIPALTKQHKYTLANMHPYSAQLMDEIGGQFDMFYSVPRNTALKWAKGIKVNLNISEYWKSKDNSNYLSLSDTLLYRDYSVEIEKKFSTGFKTNISFISQYYNYGAITGGSEIIKSNIAVIESLIPLKGNVWLKIELSELFPVKNENEWSYLMSEISFAPKWTFYVSDMIEHTQSKIHYYNVGLSFTKNTTRMSINWGEIRRAYNAQEVCVGMFQHIQE
jgi:hypothetical protein